VFAAYGRAIAFAVLDMVGATVAREGGGSSINTLGVAANPLQSRLATTAWKGVAGLHRWCRIMLDVEAVRPEDLLLPPTTWMVPPEVQGGGAAASRAAQWRAWDPATGGAAAGLSGAGGDARQSRKSSASSGGTAPSSPAPPSDTVPPFAGALPLFMITAPPPQNVESIVFPLPSMSALASPDLAHLRDSPGPAALPLPSAAPPAVTTSTSGRQAAARPVPGGDAACGSWLGEGTSGSGSGSGVPCPPPPSLQPLPSVLEPAVAAARPSPAGGASDDGAWRLRAGGRAIVGGTSTLQSAGSSINSGTEGSAGAGVGSGIASRFARGSAGPGAPLMRTYSSPAVTSSGGSSGSGGTATALRIGAGVVDLSPTAGVGGVGMARDDGSTSGIIAPSVIAAAVVAATSGSTRAASGLISPSLILAGPGPSTHGYSGAMPARDHMILRSGSWRGGSGSAGSSSNGGAGDGIGASPTAVAGATPSGSGTPSISALRVVAGSLIAAPVGKGGALDAGPPLLRTRTLPRMQPSSGESGVAK